MFGTGNALLGTTTVNVTTINGTFLGILSEVSPITRIELVETGPTQIDMLYEFSFGTCSGTQVSIKPFQIIATLKVNNQGNLNKTFFVPSTSAKTAFIQPLDMSNCMAEARKKLTLLLND